MITSPRWAKPSPREVRAQLAKRPPFDRMADEEVQWVAERVELRTWPAGAVVLEQGHESPALYFIVEGEAQMEAMGTIAEERRVLAELHPGECFPVEALEEQRPVFSTIRARSELACYQLVTAEFRELRRRSARFHEFTAHRASAFLEQSRRVFHAHFSQHDGGPSALSSPLSVLMRPRPLTCSPSTPLREALTALDEAGEEALIVVDLEGRPVGVLDLHGILRHVTLPSLDLTLPVERGEGLSQGSRRRTGERPGAHEDGERAAERRRAALVL
jgi:CBS domain-containing protein